MDTTKLMDNSLSSGQQETIENTCMHIYCGARAGGVTEKVYQWFLDWYTTRPIRLIRKTKSKQSRNILVWRKRK